MVHVINIAVLFVFAAIYAYVLWLRRPETKGDEEDSPKSHTGGRRLGAPRCFMY